MLNATTGCVAAGVLALGSVWWAFAAEAPGEAGMRTTAEKHVKAGNFKDAFVLYKKLLAEPDVQADKVADDLAAAANCLNQLGDLAELDAVIEAAVTTHGKNWKLLREAALTTMHSGHFGSVVAGKFIRGNQAGQGEYVTTMDRDRVRALQLFTQAHAIAQTEATRPELAKFYQQFAEAVAMDAIGADAWELQVLTDLAVLPDPEPGHRWGRRGFGMRGGNTRGAPVDIDGNPVLYHVPEGLAAAKSDGERWRWLLNSAMTNDEALRNEIETTWAGFLHSQFGVQTMAGFLPQDDEHKAEDATGPFAVHTLKDEETIARLATGIKRFALSGEFNPLKIYKAISERSKDAFAAQAADMVAGIYEDRRQYVAAAAAWKAALTKFGDDNHRQQRYEQIVGNWATFENVQLQPAGTGATIDLRFRNAKKITFTAHPIKISTLLEDLKAYLKSSPPQIDWQRINIGDIGHRLVIENQTKYLGEKAAEWSLDLDPKAEHVDRRITVTTPLQKAGAYLLVGKLADGNTSRVIVWLADTAIVRKQLDQQSWYFVADAITGQPLQRANVELLGWKQEQVRPNQRNYQIAVKNFSEFTDADGQIKLGNNRQPQDHQWLAVARTDAGRLAYLGFTGVWYGQYHDQQYQETKVYSITDRPVYRPDQTVKYKFWVGDAKYDQPDTSPYAHQKFTVILINPKAERVFEKPVVSDQFGGIEGEYALPKDAPLGVFHLVLKDRDVAGTFRVEEYKKPEYEVTVDAPTEPVQLGEKVTATISAKYYFGGAVTKAKVKYKVERSAHTARWYPIGRWDWFYGKGYWWFAPDYSWYPGWSNWGCVRPVPWWWNRGPQQAELVAEQEVDISDDGTVKVEIDTLPAKEIHGDQDHAYTITAEVVDDSRRTIVGTGKVLVARKPFQVSVWLDHGHYKVGDTVKAHFAAYTLDQKPVSGQGKLTLNSIKYSDDGEPEETTVNSWDLATDEQGHATQQFVASAAGQYRLSYTVTDTEGHIIEGAYVFNVLGQGFDGREFRFNDLELITDKREYAPGEKVRLLISTNRSDSTVVLFLRPSNGIALPPQVVRLTGKSTVQEIAVVQKDMPNFFIEAFTVANGKYHEELREIIVPPEKRVINVDVQTSQQEYRPGQPATVQVKLTDDKGKPFVGSTVLTVYDRSIDYIAGESTIPEIREFFWKWRRSHYPRHESNLGFTGWNILKPNEIGMNTLGAFGEVGVEMESAKSGMPPRGGIMRKGAMTRSFAADMLADGAAPAAPMAAAAPAMNALMDVERGMVVQVGGGGAAMVEPTVRSNFADTAFWAGSLTTDADGFAEVKFDMPENLTGWKVKAWALGAGTKVGEGSVEVTTKKNLLVRLQAPRFFVEKDEVVLSAIVHNDLATEKTVRVVLECEGGTLLPMSDKVDVATTDPKWSLPGEIVIPANGKQRVDWRVKVVHEGAAIVRMKALTDEESDAMQMTFPVYVHGMLKTESYSGAIRPSDAVGSVKLNVPAERRINESRLEARFSPTLAGAMVDALPYLVEYPYGCTEQTLNRFLPTVITQRILQRMQLDLATIRDKRTNLNAQELGDPMDRAKQWKRFDRNPVFDTDEVAVMVKDGVERLTSMQLSDGGWGWFSGYGEHSSAHTTATVVHGLQIAAQNDVALVPGVLDKGVAWLKRYQDEQVQLIKRAETKPKDQRWKERADATDALVYTLLVDADIANADMNEFLFRDRIELPVYAKALYGLALQKQQQAEKLATVMQNIDQFLEQDDENQTAYLKLPENNWWWLWHGSTIEANAYYLKLLTRVNPQDPKASRLVKYLLNNRKHGTYWNSTRDTGLCIEALAEYLVASGEAEPKLTIEVWLDGKKQKEVTVDKTNLFSFDNSFVLMGDAVTDGEHTLEFRKQGEGPLYFNAYLTNFTLEDHIEKAGLEVKVQRKYYKLTRVDKEVDAAGSRGQAVKEKVEKYVRTELENLATVTSGDLVEVELEIDSKNDYEYLVFEDMKASGFEPLEVRSGYAGNSLGAYVEYRDERVAFFVKLLPRGKHSMKYRLRAEIPGKFSALPTKASAMYAPELRGNSDEIKLQIEDR